MDLQKALNTLNISIESDGQYVSYVQNNGDVSKELTLNDVDLSISNHLQEITRMSETSSVGGLQYYHTSQIKALELVRDAIIRANHKTSPSIDPKLAPSLFDSEEYRNLVEIMQMHKLYKSMSVDFTFAHKLMCRTCGEMPHDTDEDLHTAHQILLAGYRI